MNQSETQVVKFDVTEAAIAEMSALYMGLVITDHRKLTIQFSNLNA